MIEFLTLLLGLVSGPQVVEVRAAEPVARVEVRVDGEVAARAESPPWRLVVDLGPELAPHEISAVARAADGRELGRAVQRVNVPRGEAEVRWVLQTGSGGVPESAGLVWEQMGSAEPERVEVRFDGRRLEVADPERFPIPQHDPEQVHLLTAELTFPEGVSARAEAVFGGRFGERVESELTAVPVVPAGDGSLSEEALQGRFRRGGEALRVAAVDRGGADVVMVRDLAAQRALAHEIAAVEQRYRRRFHRAPRDLLPLGEGARVRFVWPTLAAVAEKPGRHVDPGQFARPRVFDGGEFGLPWLVSRTEPPPVPQRVADAVALAGLLAAGGERPRAVVLAVHPATVDRSRYRPAQVRRYLERLRVPLVVWSVNGEPVPGWGDAEPVAEWSDLQAAARRLRDRLDRQAVVWLQGDHLPGEIELVGSGDGLAWAGR